MTYSNIEVFIEDMFYEGFSVTMEIFMPNEGLFQARIVDEGQVLLDRQGDKSLDVTAESLNEALQMLDELCSVR
jgi:hypothetical protein